ncbi:MAG: DUF5698 domain-containing protein [Oscillospiraceae bacterium]|nr:DUF5698 domain-containing protein [Oscillospiraceae bacterium]
MTLTVFLLCLKIFFCRILDVTFGTVRQVLTIKEKTALAALCGFVEVLIWYLVVREALSSDAGLYTAVAYAGGFATGTYIGGRIAHRFIRIKVTAQVVTSSRDDALVAAVRAAGFGVSVVNVNGSQYGDEKYLLIIEMNGSRVKELKKLVHGIDAHAFIYVEESKHVFNGFIK